MLACEKKRPYENAAKNLIIKNDTRRRFPRCDLIKNGVYVTSQVKAMQYKMVIKISNIEVYQQNKQWKAKCTN